MSDDDVRLPQLLPVLSRGKHRSPKKGACFMELASFLAGERWSDHPACSHPLLAALARDVNDCTSDTSRQRLAELIPSVIGLTSDDPHVDALIALRCATTALRGSLVATTSTDRRSRWPASASSTSTTSTRSPPAGSPGSSTAPPPA